MTAPHREPLLQVRGLRIWSGIGSGTQTITTPLDLELDRGETLGIVGESGSGKSMTARAIIGLLPPGVRAEGAVRYGGRDLLRQSSRSLGRVRGGEIAMIFQDPFTMLNPLMRCGAQIVELLRDERGHRLGRRARRVEAARRLDEVGIDDAAVVDAYPFELSGGQRQRVGIAAALARDPKLLIADEPSTALDVTTQKEILDRLKDLQATRGMALILITHDLRVAFSMCDRIAVLYAGSLLEHGDAAGLEAAPRHPYTLGLLLCEPPADRRLVELASIEGTVPRPDEVRAACAFAARCEWSGPTCTAAAPPLAEIAPGRFSSCIRLRDIAGEMTAARSAALRLADPEPARPAGEPLVRATDLHKRFGGDGRKRDVTALGAVSIELGAGESVGLVGESGSGKTTLGRCLLGLERPTSGSIVIDGIDATDYDALRAGDRRRLRSSIQMVFQDPYSTLNPVRTVGATLAEALTVHDPALRNVRERVDALLGRVGLTAAYAERKPVALSGGERQRVAIARALAATPRIIVCDEAVSALDVSVQAQILNLLVSVRRETGISYLFITHDLAVVRQVAERVYVLRRGSVVESGAVDTVLDRPRHPYTRALVESALRSDGGPLEEPASTEVS